MGSIYRNGTMLESLVISSAMTSIVDGTNSTKSCGLATQVSDAVVFWIGVVVGTQW